MGDGREGHGKHLAVGGLPGGQGGGGKVFLHAGDVRDVGEVAGLKQLNARGVGARVHQVRPGAVIQLQAQGGVVFIGDSGLENDLHPGLFFVQGQQIVHLLNVVSAP
ncbi:hypothetical protein SDC9_171674 [bioreactor metagenome]|uniref:Uncharacterized protein n=1 Tax=bioreactor metagenome TaxID=1076179 RepID=A0A645GES6_9ZZZZ